MTRIFIEDDYESFSDFHDRDWLGKQFNLTKGSRIEQQVSSFGFAWWGHARAFVLPWIFVGSVHDLIQQGPLSAKPTKQAIWDDFLEVDGFKAALWKVAESSYCGLYYAYELLIVSVVNACLAKPVSVSHREFNTFMTSHFGQKISTRLWSDPHISTAREVRNCLVHAGGAASAKLLRMQKLPKINENQIMISASDVRDLYSVLKARVELLISHEISAPAS